MCDANNFGTQMPAEFVLKGSNNRDYVMQKIDITPKDAGKRFSYVKLSGHRRKLKSNLSR